MVPEEMKQKSSVFASQEKLFFFLIVPIHFFVTWVFLVDMN